MRNNIRELKEEIRELNQQIELFKKHRAVLEKYNKESHMASTLKYYDNSMKECERRIKRCDRQIQREEKIHPDNDPVLAIMILVITLAFFYFAHPTLTGQSVNIHSMELEMRIDQKAEVPIEFEDSLTSLMLDGRYDGEAVVDFVSEGMTYRVINTSEMGKMTYPTGMSIADIGMMFENRNIKPMPTLVVKENIEINVSEFIDGEMDYVVSATDGIGVKMDGEIVQISRNKVSNGTVTLIASDGANVVLQEIGIIADGKSFRRVCDQTCDMYAGKKGILKIEVNNGMIELDKIVYTTVHNRNT